MQWTPDGDAAFDDGSYVLQFDVAEQVRLIAFKNVNHHALNVSEAWVDGHVFYGLLAKWIEEFDREWEARVKN